MTKAELVDKLADKERDIANKGVKNTKRVVQTSLLISLLSMPGNLLLNLMIPMILYEMTQEHAIISMKENSAAYKLLLKLNHLPSYYFMAFATGWMALIFFIGWRAKIFSKDNTNAYRESFKEKRKTNPNWWKLLIFRLILVIAFSISLVYLDKYFSDNILKNSLPLLASFNWRAVPLYLILIPPGIFFVFCVVSSFFAVVYSVTHSEFKEYLKVPLIGLIVLALAILTSLSIQHYLDVGKTLKDIPGYSMEEEKRELYVLYDQPLKMAQPPFYSDSLSSSSEATPPIALNANNIKVFNEYSKKKGRRTALQADINGYNLRYALRELDMPKARRLCRDWIAKDGTVAYEPEIVAPTLQFCPTHPENYELLKWLSDESKFSINNKVALHFSRAYSNFGDMDRARYWYEVYLKTHDKAAVKKDEEPPLNTPPFNRGIVSGTITVDGFSANGVRIGIIRKKGIYNKIEKFKTALYALSLFDMTDGTCLDKNGRFAFQDLVEGEYILRVSLKNDADRKIKIIDSPGAITVSKKKPAADLGIIRLAAVK
jgi:hypothetical protein